MKRTRTDLIVVHCSATPPKMDIGAAEMDKWHKERGFDRIGYHLVILRDGKRELGRDLDQVGAHAHGVNHKSVAVCLVGGVDKNAQPENNFTLGQLDTLYNALTEWRRIYPHAKIMGHRDLPNVAKACPSFDVSKWLARMDAVELPQ